VWCCGDYPGSRSVDSRKVVACVLIYTSAQRLFVALDTYAFAALARWTSVTNEAITADVFNAMW
jgi:hypothetical protein